MIFTNFLVFSSLIYVYYCYTLSDIVWGPGLNPKFIILPARYFFVKLENSTDINRHINVSIYGEAAQNNHCRIWTQVLNDGNRYIVRYKLFETCIMLQISVKVDGNHIGNSPYIFNEKIYPATCNCPSSDINLMLKHFECGDTPLQIIKDLDPFPKYNFSRIRNDIIEQFDLPGSVSLCHYVVKRNAVYRRCYGKHVGFKMFMDNILLSLARRAKLPDMEIFVNLGDWPLVRNNKPYPIFSWCGSSDSLDIVMPTYDITESTLENMGRVTLDMLSVQGNSNTEWSDRIEKCFWRGRDSNRKRLLLKDISREHQSLLDVSFSNFFFFRDLIEEYGPAEKHVPFYDFFKFKYLVNIDGTVAAYRLPYLLAGGSLVLKQSSKYYEHFYNSLQPYKHFLPIKEDLSDLVAQINWAIINDEESKSISENAKKFTNENLLPQNIICYYAHLFAEYSTRNIGSVKVLDGMETVEQVDVDNCDCNTAVSHDEL